MRLKHIINRLRIGERLKIIYERITLTGFTKAFILIALAHCLAQIALQVTALSFNKKAGDRLTRIIDDSTIPPQYAFVSGGQLLICSGLPPSGDPFDTVCWPIAGPGVALPDTERMARGDGRDGRIHSKARFVDPPASKVASRDLSAVLVLDDGDVVAVNITGLNDDDPEQVTQLSARCVRALNWPGIVSRDAQREDISFLFYQVWLFGISLVTLLNESIPHLVAALLTHGFSTAWNSFQLARTDKSEQYYFNLVVNDACEGVDVIPGFWDNRMKYFIPIVVLNAVILLFSFGVSFKLFTVYARQTFKRVGASKSLNLLYSYVLLFSVFLQLSAFFTIAGSALWIDALSNGVLKGTKAYRIIFTIASVIELPWVIIGWISIRREYHWLSLIFILVGLALCAAWTSMFATILYKWEFQNFPFFATLTITAFVILVGTVVLAIVCRINFGKGLPRYLKTEETFDDSSFIPVIVPKGPSKNIISVAFPDRRTSEVRNGGSLDLDEKPPLYIENAYGRPQQRPPPQNSIIEIMASSRHQSVAGPEFTNAPSAAAPDGHGGRRSSRSRLPFLRQSDNSRSGTGKPSLRFFAFTSNSSAADLERGVPDVPEMPLLPKEPQAVHLETSGLGPSKPGLTKNLSTFSRAADLPAINVIPASVQKSNIILEQGDLLVQAASETNSFASDSWVDSYAHRSAVAPSHTRLGLQRSYGQGLSGSPPRNGLPSNPRAFRR